MPRIPRSPAVARPIRRAQGLGWGALALAFPLLLAAPAGAGVVLPPDPIFASDLVSFDGTTPFTGGNVLGAPDRSGRFLALATDPHPLEDAGALVLRFALGVLDGPGCDLIVVDVDRDPSNESEQAEVEVSGDGVAWSPIASVFGGTAEGRVDFAGRLEEPVFFVRIRQSATSAFALDVDALQANYPIPEPGSAALLAAGLALLARTRPRAR